MSMIKLKRILVGENPATFRPAATSGFSGISGYSGISGVAVPIDPPVVVDPPIIVDPPIADNGGDGGTLPIPPGTSGYSGISGYSGETEPVEPVEVEVDVYINPAFVIAIEPDVQPNICNMHLTTGWYRIVGDMESVVSKMESWFSKRSLE